MAATYAAWPMRRPSAVGGGLTGSFEHGFDTNGMISILDWRICHEVVQAGFDRTSLLFARAIPCASLLLRSQRLIQRTAASPARATLPSRVAATGRADRLVPGRFGCADPRSLDVSNRDRRGGPLDAKSSRPERGKAGQRGRQTALGPERKGPHPISLGS